MIDTVGCKAIISSEDFQKIKEKTLMTQRIDKETGEVEFEYDNGQTNHSHNYRVVYKITDEYWTSDKPEDAEEGQGSKRLKAVKKSGIPHVKLEFSVPKMLWGHNLHSAGMALIYDAMYVVKRAFEGKYQCVLPPMHEWYCYRLDTCANYVLPSEKEVRSYIAYLSKLDYPRREPYRYGDSGIYFPSRQNTLKAYAKGPEFKVNDKKRFIDPQNAQELFEEAKKILRIEVEHKQRIRYLTGLHNSPMEDRTEYREIESKLKYWKHEIERLNEERAMPDADANKIDREIERVKKKITDLNGKLLMFTQTSGDRFKTFEGYPRMKDLIGIFSCEEEMQSVLDKLLSGTSSRVTESLAVEGLIRGAYSKRQAATFIAVYYTVIHQGQTHTKNVFERNIYYRALKAFRELGISLVAGETVSPDNADMGFPSDFRLDMDESNPYYQLPIRSLDDADMIGSEGEAF